MNAQHSTPINSDKSLARPTRCAKGKTRSFRTGPADALKAREFADWLLSPPRNDAWQGRQMEKFVSWDEYTRVKFREWAMERDLAPSRWRKVFNEFVEG